MIVAKKKNMTQVYDEKNNVVPVTILDYSDLNLVDGAKKSGKFLTLGKRKKPSKQLAGVFGENLPEFFMSVSSEIAELDTFAPGDEVQVMGFSKGKGFAGVMRMWNFRGGKRTHGQSDRERHPGSIGTRTIPGRVFKGKKMGRRKGNEKVTVKGLEIVSIDPENKLMCVKGSVPGTYNSVVYITKK
jgi:large subunit ribosomal protein L3